MRDSSDTRLFCLFSLGGYVLCLFLVGYFCGDSELCVGCNSRGSVVLVIVRRG